MTDLPANAVASSPDTLKEVARQAVASRCPALVGYNPLDPEQIADPSPMWALAQSYAPVQYLPSIDMWMVTSYDVVAEILRDPVTYSSRRAYQFPPVPNALKDRMPLGWPQFAVETLINADPPVHAPIRKLAQKALSPRAVAAREPAIRAIAIRRLDELSARGGCDLVGDFAKPYTIEVVADVLGVEDPAAKARFGPWADDSFELANPFLPEQEVLVRGANLADAQDFLEAMIELRRAEPRDDLITRLVQAQEDGTSLSTPQIVSIALQLLIAGSDTTSSLIVSTVYLALTRFPEQWDRMRRDPEAIPSVLEEMLRYKSPVRGIIRVTTKEVELAGTRIPADAQVFVCTAAACNDAAQFPEPNRFESDRENINRHVSFAKGIHFCLGAPLARLEARVALEEMMTRIPDLGLRDDVEPAWSPFLLAQGLNELPVRCTA